MFRWRSSASFVGKSKIILLRDNIITPVVEDTTRPAAYESINLGILFVFMQCFHFEFDYCVFRPQYED